MDYDNIIPIKNKKEIKNNGIQFHLRKYENGTLATEEARNF
jgi:hypothetical protein